MKMMKYRRAHRILPLFLAFIAGFSLLPNHFAFAEGNHQLVITQTPSNASVNTPFTVYVKAYIDSTTSPQTAIGSVTYPSNLLRVTGKTSNGGAFGSPILSESPGTITFNASRNSSDTGFAQIFTINFLTIGAGTAVIGFSGDSKVNYATTGYKSGVVSISSPNPVPSPSTTPKPLPSTQPSPTTIPIPSTTPTPITYEPQPTPDPSGVVDNVLVTPTYTSSTITWKVNATNPKSIVSYGTKSTALDKQGTVTSKPDGNFSTEVKDLIPGNRYYFTITGSGDGGKSGTYSGTILANGYPVAITVTENNEPAKGAQVKIGNIFKTTDSNGKATLGLAAGKYTGTITTNTASLSIDITVASKTIPTDGTSPEAQQFSYKLTSSPLEQGPGSGTPILVFVGILAVGTVIMGAGFAGFMAYRRRKFETGEGTARSSGSGTTVIIDDGYDWRQNATSPPPPSASSTPTLPDSDIKPRHNNSVYIDDEEPLDMFEQGDNHLPPAK